MKHIVLKLSMMPNRYSHQQYTVFFSSCSDNIRTVCGINGSGKASILSFAFAHRHEAVVSLAVVFSCLGFKRLMTNIPFILLLQILRQYYCDVRSLKDVNCDMKNGFSFEAFGFAVITRTFFNVEQIVL